MTKTAEEQPITVSTLPRYLKVGDSVLRDVWVGPFPTERVRTIKTIRKFRPSYGGPTKYRLSFEGEAQSITIVARNKMLKVVG